MKKIFASILFVFMVIMLSGCGSKGEKDILKNLSKKIDVEAYYLDGKLEIVNNEDSYQYDVEAAYKSKNNFRVSLKNKVNNHEQIILKNEEGVYVLTPSLNKSFKFQSEWPYNNSQSYLLQTVIQDLKNDENLGFEENNDGYIFTSTVNYANNPNLVKQKVYLDKDLNIKEVIVLNNEDVMQMKMTYNSIDYKATFDDSYFTLKGNMSNVDTNTTSKSLDSIIYPMYVPANTYLSGQEKVMVEDGERVILTFNGDSPFMVIQETIKPTEELLTIPMYGEPYIVTGTVGALSDSSVTWVNNGVEFYVVSDVLNTNDLLQVANSIGTLPVGK
ncbi:putative lipoprotein [Acholeplasma sp. CAG:878]|nr:putative lipoprotein [Acholeplasma sp. CAG:878]